MNKTFKVNHRTDKYNALDYQFELFNKNLVDPPYFKNDNDEAVLYYQDQLTLLLNLSGRSLDHLISESVVAQHPTLPAVLAKKLLNYIDKCQDL